MKEEIKRIGKLPNSVKFWNGLVLVGYHRSIKFRHSFGCVGDNINCRVSDVH
jgi:hypothetical protein